MKYLLVALILLSGCAKSSPSAEVQPEAERAAKSLHMSLEACDEIHAGMDEFNYAIYADLDHKFYVLTEGQLHVEESGSMVRIMNDAVLMDSVCVVSVQNGLVESVSPLLLPSSPSCGGAFQDPCPPPPPPQGCPPWICQ
jgi:hypothetical protein